MKKQIIFTLTFLLCFVAAIAQNGSITNIAVSQGTGNDLRMVDILFDLAGIDTFYDITLEVSFNDGADYVAIHNANVMGDTIVASGSDIHLVWDGSVNHSAQSAQLARIKITATTHYVPTIDDYYQGGVVFYLDGSGGGLVCAITDQDGGSGIQWFNGDYTTTGATATAIGTGQANTTAIIDSQNPGSYAATVCTALGEGWFLPSKDELNVMYQNKAAINVTAIANGGDAFVSTHYWSSSEIDFNYAWRQSFTDSYQNNGSKDYSLRVRAVRAF